MLAFFLFSILELIFWTVVDRVTGITNYII
jgi:hypothetical protein